MSTRRARRRLNPGSRLLPAGIAITGVAFLAAGAKDGWDAAAKAVYGFETVDALEEAWSNWVGRSASGGR